MSDQNSPGNPGSTGGPSGQPAQPQYAPPQQPKYASQQSPQYAQPQQPPQYAQPQQPQYASQYGAPQYAAPQYAASPYSGMILPPAGPGEPFDGASHPDDLSRPLYGATFSQAVGRFFRNYVNFEGRASRSEYWWVALALGLAAIIPSILYVTGIIMASVSSYRSGAGTGAGLLLLSLGGILFFALWAGTFLPWLAVTWRRLHDSDLPGPMYFLSFIPYAGGIILIVLACRSPRPGGRRYLSRR